MKTKIYFFLAIAFLTANLAAAQVLYSEDFDNLAIGDLGTDITGQTPGQGGWYTGNNQGGNSDFQITAEPGRGNVLQIQGTYQYTGGQGLERRAFQKGLDVPWRQRTPGNNICKLSFDFYIDEHYGFRTVWVELFPKQNPTTYRLAKYEYYHGGGIFSGLTGRTKDHSTPRAVGYDNHGFQLDADSWITLELYLDYNTSKVYFGIPSLGLMREYDYDPFHTLSLNDPVYPEDPPNDEPFMLQIAGFNESFTSDTRKIKIDNISIAAVSTAPTVGINEPIALDFNVFPNPAEDIVYIADSEEMQIHKIEVADVSGKILNSETYHFPEKTVLLNIASLSKGAYLLKIHTEKGTAVKKLIKK